MSESSYFPRISIVITSYNQGRYLADAIESVISQDYSNLELVIIDGGSTDKSKDIIQQYEPRLSYWASEADNGQSEAINKGFQKCTGDIITFLSSDDLYLPNACTYVAEQWKKHPGCGAIVGGFKFIDENGEFSENTISPRLPYPSPIDLRSIPPKAWRLHQVSTFYTRNALDQVGRNVREDLLYVMDRELLFRVAKEFEIVLDERPYAAFRRHSESKSMVNLIPFGEEFGNLYLEALSEDKADNKNKERFAKYFRAKGYFSFAKYQPNLIRSSAWFFRAAQIYPRFLTTKNYWKSMIKKLWNK